MFLRKGFRGSRTEGPRSDLQVALYSRKALSARSLWRRAKQAWRNLLTTKMTVHSDHSDRIITLAKNAQVALRALLSRASLGMSRVVETERKRAERFMAMAPRSFKPFKLENLYSYIRRSVMSRRRPETHNSGADWQYSLTARRSEEVSAEPGMKRPAGVTIIAIATFVGAAILALGALAFLLCGRDGDQRRRRRRSGFRVDCGDGSGGRIFAFGAGRSGGLPGAGSAAIVRMGANSGDQLYRNWNFVHGDQHTYFCRIPRSSGRPDDFCSLACDWRGGLVYCISRKARCEAGVLERADPPSIQLKRPDLAVDIHLKHPEGVLLRVLWPKTIPAGRDYESGGKPPHSKWSSGAAQRIFTARAASKATIVREMIDCTIMPILAQRERTAVSVGEKAVLVLKARNR